MLPRWTTFVAVSKISPGYRLFLFLHFLAQNDVLEAIAFALDPLHEPAGPHKFSCEQTQSEKNHQPARPGRNKHNGTGKQKSKTSYDSKDAANLLDRAEEHGVFGKRLCGGEGGIRTHGRISPTHAFQACSLNRSDTSPLVETTLPI